MNRMLQTALHGGALLKRVLEAVSDGVVIIDRDGVIQFVNRTATRLMPSDGATSVGQLFPYDFPSHTQSEVTVARPSGDKVHLNIEILPIDWNGQAARLATIRDITERRKAEEGHSESQQALESLMNNLPGMAYRCANDKLWTMWFVSQGCEALTGYRAEDLIENRTVAYGELIHPDEADYVWDAVQVCVRERKQFHVEYRIITQEGQEKWVAELGNGVFSETGRLLAVEGFITDIHERKTFENALRVSEERLTLALEGTDLALWDYDIAKDELFVNDQWYAMLGYTPHEFQATFEAWRQLVHPDDQPRVLKRFDAHLAGNTPLYECDIRMKTKNGDWRWVITWGKVVARDGHGQPLRITGTHRDITDRKEMETALHKERKSLKKKVATRTKELRNSLKKVEFANLQLQEVNRHKSKFLSAMSHELRTPLNAVLGFADLLRGEQFGPLNEKQLTYVRHVEEAGQHLLSLINDLLDIAKIDAGAMDLEITELAPDEFIRPVIDMMGSQWRKKNLTVNVCIQPDLPTIAGDPKRCKQILFNLLSNAIKYTPEGGVIEVSAKVSASEAVTVMVQDDGIGIEPERLDQIFAEFQQVDRQRDEAMGGVGLGLAVTRRLVELHGGLVGVDSTPGKGSTFWFALPVRQAAPQVSEPDETPEPDTGQPTRQRRILVAEDNPANAELILDILSIHEHVVMLATNGAEVIELAQSFNPELIFMDMQMPKLDGLEATRRLRAMPEFATIPIIALTASAGYESEQRCLDAGCTAHLAKPITAVAVNRALSDAEHALQSGARPETEQSPP